MSRRKASPIALENHFIITSNGLEEFPTPDTFLSQKCKNIMTHRVDTIPYSHHVNQMNMNMNYPYFTAIDQTHSELFKMKIPFLLN